MNKNFIQIMVLVLFGMVIVGCESTPVDTTTEKEIVETKEGVKKVVKEKLQTEEESFEKISEAVKSGKSMRCVVEVTDEEFPEPITINYWIKGEDIRIESNMMGIEQVVVTKGDLTYMKPNNMIGGNSACDWIEDSDEEGEFEENMDEDYDMSNSDFDYEEFENDSNYKIKCEKESFGNEKFETDGNICSMEDIMGEMMKGINIEGMDFENMGMEDMNLDEIDMEALMNNMQ